jgi:hypothetical protein
MTNSQSVRGAEGGIDGLIDELERLWKGANMT